MVTKLLRQLLWLPHIFSLRNSITPVAMWEAGSYKSLLMVETVHFNPASLSLKGRGSRKAGIRRGHTQHHCDLGAGGTAQWARGSLQCPHPYRTACFQFLAALPPIQLLANAHGNQETGAQTSGFLPLTWEARNEDGVPGPWLWPGSTLTTDDICNRWTISVFLCPWIF